MNIPRPEYPRPQFVRPAWLCLNGEWQFEVDSGDSGFERDLVQRELAEKITVPFCPESTLSGLGYTDFMNAVWYRRTVEIPKEWGDRRILLHFQAVDYDTTVWVNGTEVGRHRGGFTPFTFNLEHIARGGDTVNIVVRARDYYTPPQPRGKQSQRYANYSCFYTRTTGIWQTVWMEPVPHCSLQRPRFTPNADSGSIRLDQGITNSRKGLRLEAKVSDADGDVCIASTATGMDGNSSLILAIPAEKLRYWSPQDPHLYDVVISLYDETGGLVDRCESYSAVRGISIEGKTIRLNGEVVFQRLVLDQGYYPDGIMTAPTEEDLVKDIELAFAAGFNGARLHQKIFEERFLYHADRMGYLCWGEFPDWGCRGIWPDDHYQNHGITYTAQWVEAMDRDYSHPSIIGWCPLNETYQEITDHITELDDAARAMYLVTKAMDSTRPVLDASGYSHRVQETDVFDCHDYEQDPARFRENHAHLAEGRPFLNGPANRPWSITYRGQPFWVSEFGGIWWADAVEREDASWGYGQRPASLEEFYARFEGLCTVLLDHEDMFGYCYTQLTDVFQEKNGVYTSDRRPKFDLDIIRHVQQRAAAIEIKYNTPAGNGNDVGG